MRHVILASVVSIAFAVPAFADTTTPAPAAETAAPAMAAPTTSPAPSTHKAHTTHHRVTKVKAVHSAAPAAAATTTKN